MVAVIVVSAIAVAVGACAFRAKAEIEDVQAAMTELSLQQVGAVTLHSSYITVTYVEDGVWKYANYSDGEATVSDTHGTQYGWKLVPLAELKLSELEQQLAAVQGDRKCSAEVGVTQGGARLSYVDCGRDRVSTAINGKEIAEITQWDAAGIDQALAELQAVSGPTIPRLTFSSPRPTKGVGPTLRADGVEITGAAAGQRCFGSYTRHGASPGSPGELSAVTCQMATNGQEPQTPPEAPIVLAEVSGAKLYRAWTDCAAELGISPSQISEVFVNVREDGLTLQSPADARTCVVTVG